MKRLYGTLRLAELTGHRRRREGDKPWWTITCEPQVALRLKRIFAKISKSEFGALTLSDTPENARELLWALERYPMTVHDGAYLRAQARKYDAKLDHVRKLLDGYIPPPACEMAVPAREYQRQPAGILIANGALLLADDLGIGKTCSAIATFTHAATLPALVVTATHLPPQWRDEVRKFMPHLHVYVTKTGQPCDMTIGPRGRKDPEPDVVITSYSKLAGWSEALAGRVKSVVFDEIQDLHTGTGEKYHAAMHIAREAKFCMGLSATPINNYGGEIYNVLNVLREDFIGEKEEFHREWCTSTGGMGAKYLLREPRVFGAYLREQGILLRRTKADVGRELPGLTVVEHEVSTNTKAIDEISDRAAELAWIILGQSGHGRGDQMRAAEELSWRLRQATGIAKAPYVADFVRMLIESGEPVLLFGWHRAVYDIWQDRLKDLNPVFFTGEETTAQKNEAKRKFMAGETKLMVLSLRSGAGIDGLQTVCRNVVYGELDWSPAIHEQGVGRVYRDGQLYPVFVYLLLAAAGSDPVIADVLGLKRIQIEGIKNPNADVIEKLQVDPDKMKRLAEQFLKQRGRYVPRATAAV